jgi:hypothetical protein
MRVGGALAGAVLVVSASAAAAADDEPICADRPGLATATCTVPAGTVQVEIGLVDWTRDRADDVRSSELKIGEMAVSLGLTDRFHIDVAVSSYNRATVREGDARERASGLGDMAIAAKYRLTSDSAPLQLALRPFVKIPTAKRSLGNGKVDGGVIVPIDYAIPGSQLSLTVAPELDVNADGDGSGHHLATAQVVSVGATLSARLSTAAELWGYWDFDPAGTVRQYAVAASAAYLLSNDVQFDAGVVLGLNRETPDVELYSGIAFRF